MNKVCAITDRAIWPRIGGQPEIGDPAVIHLIDPNGGHFALLTVTKRKEMSSS
jgi:hypothetical protein